MSNMADLSNILANGVIFSTLKHTDLHTVRGRPTLKDGLCNERIFRNGSFRELKIAKESNDLAKVSLESNQKSNELSVNRKCGQSDRRTFADKDKVPRYQTLGNDDKDAMLDFHQSEDKRNCYIYVTSIVIIKLTFVMFLLKQSTLSAVIFPFVPLVLSLLCVYYIRILLSRNVCLVPNEVVSNECDDVLDNVAPCIEQKCGESALCIQQNDVAKEIKYAKEFRSRYAMFVNHCNINNGDYHVRRRFDREPSRIPVKILEKFSRKNSKTVKVKKLVCRRILKNIPVSSKMYRYIKCRLRTRSNNDSIKFVQKMRKKWHSTRSTLNRKSSSCRESLGKYLSLYSCNTFFKGVQECKPQRSLCYTESV